MLVASARDVVPAQESAPSTPLHWVVDTRWSRISFSPAEGVGEPVSARIASVEGLMDVDGDPSGARVNVKARLAPEAGGGDQALPALGFRSKSVETLPGRRYRVRGDAVVEGTTRPLEVTLVECGRGRDGDGTPRLRLAGAGRVDLAGFPALGAALGRTWSTETDPVVQLYLELDVLGVPTD